MNKYLKSVAITGCIVTALLSACGKKDAQAIATEGSTTFKSADPGIKAAWDTAIAADKTNGYVVAISTLQMLAGQPGLSEKQSDLVRKTLTAISDKMYDAVNRNDPAAKAALDDLRQLRGR